MRFDDFFPLESFVLDHPVPGRAVSSWLVSDSNSVMLRTSRMVFRVTKWAGPPYWRPGGGSSGNPDMVGDIYVETIA